MGGNESTNSGRNCDSSRTKSSGSELAMAGLAVAGAVAVGAALASCSDASSKKKTMKAPGRDYQIYRDDFENDPKSYFRDLRKKG